MGRQGHRPHLRGVPRGQLACMGRDHAMRSVSMQHQSSCSMRSERWTRTAGRGDFVQCVLAAVHWADRPVGTDPCKSNSSSRRRRRTTAASTEAEAEAEAEAAGAAAAAAAAVETSAAAFHHSSSRPCPSQSAVPSSTHAILSFVPHPCAAACGVQKADAHGLVVISEDNDGNTLLVHRISKEDIYHRTGGEH